ncbi:HsdR family type I site-specific deoxyribonuclease [Mycoplasmopsis ciconiae]|uniref:Type I restriction enzyme endonuclease subunit n=1 Tax=Mycoplasmopsis ciconiae TaxID=561067 RepID=A0ABU7MMM6_9BACT|nr:HsdR family type I site-specific deoxyribonuclease [Mycoplasmopsis ciconiae]
MTFKNEREFQDKLIEKLTQRGWDKEVLNYPTKEDLIQNWKNILYKNNRDIDRLGNYPLTNTEMDQIIRKINELKEPWKINQLINGKTISIKRDNPDDKLHYGKEVSLKIYDRNEIAGGKSTYQIAKEPRFYSADVGRDKRGDLLLLINGMPLIHIELKKSGVPIYRAYNQIEQYYRDDIFSGIYGLVQIFVAMTPEETLYFANPGNKEKFNKNFYFHWADSDNKIMNKWDDIASLFLSIPMAHQLVGFYTVADTHEKTLKVLRSYQYYACNAISDKVTKIDMGNLWGTSSIKNKGGGYIWHTTGSGKTMTSFKTAQLISNSGRADKVVFLTDRIELGIQSLNEYRSFAGDENDVQGTENTYALINKLKSKNPNDTLIVTSIQKMSEIKLRENLSTNEFKTINEKRIVFIVDECHRSSFGEMMLHIKNLFTKSVFFGFTGTPIFDVNNNKGATTKDIFGEPLHKYLIANGIIDKNVLPFDHYMVETFDYNDTRKKLANYYSRSSRPQNEMPGERQQKTYKYWAEQDNIIIEKTIKDLYDDDQNFGKNHKDCVVQDVLNDWNKNSSFNTFHAIFAANSIDDAITYYKLFRDHSKLEPDQPKLSVTCVFDSSLAYADPKKNVEKEKNINLILNDYNQKYGTKFDYKSWNAFRKDVADRLAHKNTYVGIDNPSKSHQQLNMVIVVDQMLTGYDSKWVNTIYLDKLMEYHTLIQAFSRTNRISHISSKKHGIIKYYRYVYKMKENIENAFEKYASDQKHNVFVDSIEKNILKINLKYREIEDIFDSQGIKGFSELPPDSETQQKILSCFKSLTSTIQTAVLQGLKFGNYNKNIKIKMSAPNQSLKLVFDEIKYETLKSRVSDIVNIKTTDEHEKEYYDFEIMRTIHEIDTGRIDEDYLNKIFKDTINEIKSNSQLISLENNKIIEDLTSGFSFLSFKDQEFAKLILHDIISGRFEYDPNKEFSEILNEYKYKKTENRISNFANTFGLDETKLRKIIDSYPTKENINEYGKFDEVYKTANENSIVNYYTNKGIKSSAFMLKRKFIELLKNFIIDQETEF